MEIRSEISQLLSHLEGDDRFNGEKAEFIALMKKLPNFDYSKFYSSYDPYKNKILQGDALAQMPVISLPDTEVEASKVLVFSNSCDVDLDNVRMYQPSVLYSPILSLAGYEAALHEELDTDNDQAANDRVRQHIDEIRKQKINQIFYLPASQYQQDELIVCFDRIHSADSESVNRDELTETKKFSLSSYGWYMFLIKMNHFFNRTTDETATFRFTPAE